MKVLYLSHTAQVSGAERALLTLLQRLPGAISPAVACPEGPLAAAVREMGIPVFTVSATEASLKLHPVFTPQAAAQMAASAVVLRRLARRFGADLVHANSIRAGVIAALAQRMGGAPAAVHLHDHLPPAVLSTAALEVISQLPSGILACSNYVLEQLPRERPRGVTRVVHNPVDTRHFDPGRIDREAARAKLGLAATDAVLALVAQITPWKGQDDAVRTLWRLKKRHPEVRLLLVGSPKFVGRQTRHDNLAFSSSLDELIASLGLRQEVRRLGEQPDVPEILRAADILVAPSWEEPFSLSVIEGMAMELPVVATQIGGLGEIVDGGNGLLLSPRQPDRWAVEIERLVEQPALRQTMGQKARSTVVSKLEAGRWSEGVIAAYDAILAGPAEVGVARRPRPPQPLKGRRLKVLYVNHTSQVSGAERSLLILLEGLDGAVAATVACPEGRLSDELRKLGVKTVPIQGTHGSLRLSPWQTPLALVSLGRAAKRIRQAAEKADSDVIHANSIRAGISAGIASRLGGPPAVIHIRDRLPPGVISSLTFRLLAATAGAVVSNSRYTADGFVAVAPRATVRVLHNPVDVSRFDPDRLTYESARGRLGLEPGQPVLGIVAQITPWKAQDDAIRIAAALRRSHPDLRLLIVGSAKFVSRATRFDNLRYLRELEVLRSSLGVEENVIFLGEREDIPEILGALDILLMPSWEEPFGRALIEAMAMRVPVVATRVGGPAEIITDGKDGVLLPPRRPALWAQVVGELLDQPDLREEMGARGRECVKSNFDLTRHVHDVLALYQEVVGSRG